MLNHYLLSHTNIVVVVESCSGNLHVINDYNFCFSKIGWTALIETADGQDHRDVVALLLDRGANIEAASNVINDKDFSIFFLIAFVVLFSIR